LYKEYVMVTVLSAVVAIAPFAVVFALLALARRRERRRHDVRARQIALTDGVHERLGAVTAPVVRRRRGGWQVRMAVPFERPAVIEALLAIVLEVFAPRDRDRPQLEIVLTRQAAGPAATRQGDRGIRREESLSWT
jgi:hypothetical protein